MLMMSNASAAFQKYLKATPSFIDEREAMRPMPS
jgi:hypothetical protein